MKKIINFLFLNFQSCSDQFSYKHTNVRSQKFDIIVRAIYYSHPGKIKFHRYGILSMVNVWVPTMDIMEPSGQSMSTGIQQHLYLHQQIAPFECGMCKPDVKEIFIHWTPHVDAVHLAMMEI